MKNSFYINLTKNHKTPLYVYDGSIIENQYHKIQQAFANIDTLQINYAIKALSTIAILKFVKKLGSCVDTVSLNEVKLAFLAGFKSYEIFYTPNGASFSEILEVHKLDVHITLDNLIQIKQFAKLKSNKAIGIRLNPNIKAGGNKKIRVAKKNSKFGLAINKTKKLHKLIAKHNLKIDGFHFHLGSDIENSATYKKAANTMFTIAKEFKNLKFLNFGGGFKVKYKKEDKETNINFIGEFLTNAFNEFEKQYKGKLKLILEPGKFLVSNSGVFLSEITTIKKNNVFVNSGFNHLIRPMYYNAFHQINNISSNVASKKKYNIVGHICELDFFGKNRSINKPHVGDIICIENAGAYCFTMASNYNSRLRPLELLVYNDEMKIIRKAEVFDDLIKNQVF